FFFPDSPTTAWFLTPEERAMAIQRIKVNQAGVENKRWKKDHWIGRGYASILMFVPALLGSILVNTLQDSNRVGLLFSYWVSIFFIVPFPIFLGWASSITSGHTKRTTTNAVILIAYALGNAAGPFMWKKKYQPRNHVPWIVISCCIFAGAVLIFILRTMLARENEKRNKETRDETYDDVYIQKEKEDGTKVEQRVDKAFLDLTDIQNRDFRYIL
ncbi:hypothetical protein EST38_g7118, partial [Candolleomyces aberdarensis]